MSSNAQPITLTRFASALSDLSIESIYAKHSELRNNIAHMESSNIQLEEFAREHDDRDCYEALLENRQVIKRFEERIEALRNEVMEVRGLPWRPIEDEGKGVKTKVNGGGVCGVNGAGGAEQRSEEAGTQGGREEDGVFL